jgi:hypothetical protein
MVVLPSGTSPKEEADALDRLGRMFEATYAAQVSSIQEIHRPSPSIQTSWA